MTEINVKTGSAQHEQYHLLTSGPHLSHCVAGCCNTVAQVEDSSTNFTAMKTPIQKTPTFPRSNTFSASFPVPSCTCFASVRTPAQTECCHVNFVTYIVPINQPDEEDTSAVPPFIRLGIGIVPKANPSHKL